MPIRDPKSTALIFGCHWCKAGGRFAVGFARIGTWLWISGQQIGSLACTDVSIAFDLFWVVLAGVLEG
jgi:hypothetical protein